MRVFVTGATGFIGRHVLLALAARGAAIEVLARPSSDLSVVDEVHGVVSTGDILSPPSYQEAVSRSDLVIHLASMLKRPWDPAFTSIHVDGTAALASACAVAPRRPPLLVVSSLAALGPTEREAPIEEDRPPSPVSVYGRAKRDAELRAIAFSDDLPVTIVRPPAVYGPWDTSLVQLFRSVKRGIHVAPGNAQMRLSMVQVEDLAEGIIEAGLRGERVRSPHSEDGSGVYFMAGDERPTYGELGALVAHAMDVSAPRTIVLPRFASRWAALFSEGLARSLRRSTVLNRDKILEAHSGDWLCSSQKAMDQLSWRPSQSLAEHLRDTAAWYSARGWL